MCDIIDVGGKTGEGKGEKGREGPLVLAYTPWCEILSKTLDGNGKEEGEGKAGEGLQSTNLN